MIRFMGMNACYFYSQKPKPNGQSCDNLARNAFWWFADKNLYK